MPIFPSNRFERVPIQVFETADEGSRRVAVEIASLIKQRQSEGKKCVLGLATGSTPMAVYRELIRLHREEGLSFRNVVTFNLDEYYPMAADSAQSYRFFMEENLFRHVDIPASQTQVPDGSGSKSEIPRVCQDYEDAIRDAGGIDLQILGIGRTGHIGFNEPGSTRRSRTRLITLDHLTRRDNAPYFPGVDQVPHQALTMGIGTILEARRVILMAFGEHKAATVAASFEREPSTSIPASYLQEHDNVCVILDHGASLTLTRSLTPWLTGPLADLGLNWDDRMIRKAVTWLSGKKSKPVLKLTDSDYNEEGLDELLANYGPAYDLNLKVFRALQATITGWPAGRPDESGRPKPQRILVFSPHPDDDVISMGGTLLRLADQGHDVHVAYQVSGTNAVQDLALDKFVRFAEFYKSLFQSESEPVLKLPPALSDQQKKKLKSLIRRMEAVYGAAVCSVPEDRLHFLNLPFYEARGIAKNPISETDVALVVELLKQIQPCQIYAAGDLADPHGTHHLCLQAVAVALQQLQQESWMKTCDLWLYRGAWQSWDIHEVDMTVPLSPGELLRKRKAIFQHETQKDQAMFLGEDQREFWQRAEDRNRLTAESFNELGLAEYEALETFGRFRPEMIEALAKTV